MRKAAVPADTRPKPRTHTSARAPDEAPTTGRRRRRTYRTAVVSTPDRRAHTGDGAWLCASGSQVWRGTRPAFAPNPTSTSRNAVTSTLGGIRGAARRSPSQVKAYPPASLSAQEGQDHVLPRGLQGLTGPVESHEEHRQEGRELHGDPHQGRVQHEGDGKQGEQEQVEVDVVPAQAAPAVLPVRDVEISPREEGRRRAHEGHEPDHETPQSVDPHHVPERNEGVPCGGDLEDRAECPREGRHGPGARDQRSRPPSRPHPGDRRRRERSERDQEGDHGAGSSLRVLRVATSVVPTCSCRARVRSPMTKAMTRTSKDAASSAISGRSGATATPARKAPFSMARIAMTWGTASRRTASV